MTVVLAQLFYELSKIRDVWLIYHSACQDEAERKQTDNNVVVGDVTSCTVALLDSTVLKKDSTVIQLVSGVKYEKYILFFYSLRVKCTLCIIFIQNIT